MNVGGNGIPTSILRIIADLSDGGEASPQLIKAGERGVCEALSALTAISLVSQLSPWYAILTGPQHEKSVHNDLLCRDLECFLSL
jgi:hypothetical protein